MMAIPLAVFVLCAQSSLPQGESISTCTDASGAVCRLASVPSDDSSSLVQLRRQDADHTHEFPDFGKEFSKAADYVRSMAGGAQEVAAKATRMLSEATEKALTTLANTLNRTFAVVAEDAKELQARVHATKPNISSGIASLLARNLKVSIRAVPVGKQFEEQAFATFDQAITVWKAANQSLAIAILALAQGLEVAGLSSIAAVVNSSLQLALANASAFVISLEKVRAELAGIERQSPAALLEAGVVEGWGWFRTGSTESLTQKVNDTLQVVESYTMAFPKALMDAFATLRANILQATRSILLEDASQIVHASFAGAQNEVDLTAQRLGNSSLELIDGIRAGLSAAQLPPPVKSGVAALLHVTSLLFLPLLWLAPHLPA